MSQSDDFGKRGAPQPMHGLPPDHTSKPVSPFVKQVAGMALGIALAIAIGAGSVYTMKQVGKSLDGKFIETARQGEPQAAIKTVREGGDRALQRAHQNCTDLTATKTLNRSMGAAGNTGQWLGEGEQSLQQAAAYTSCLTTEQPQRFCDQSHREHLVKAVREYLKMRQQVREEWLLQRGGPNVQFTMMTGIKESDRVSPPGAPSGRFDPQLREGLRSLAANGLLSVSTFGGFAGFGAPLDVVDALKGIEVKKDSCA